MVQTVLRVEKLTKHYGPPEGGFVAVDGISFELREGEVLGLLGPNGAGKTTTIQMLLGLTTPTAGEISYFGKNFYREREYCLSRINFVSAYSQVQARLTVRQNLRIYAGLYEVEGWEKKVEELVLVLGIGTILDELYWQLSSGQKTRVNLAKALLSKPKILLMDEPTASLDPEIANKVVELIGELQEKEGVAILYTSHNMQEVARVCDRVMFLDRGEIVAEDTPMGLTKMVGEAELVVTFDGEGSKVSKYLEEKKFTFRYIREQVVEVEVPEEKIPKVLFGLSNRGVWLTDIDIRKPDLEDVFLKLARGGKNEMAFRPPGGGSG